jgi:hypothetical protein
MILGQAANAFRETDFSQVVCGTLIVSILGGNILEV